MVVICDYSRSVNSTKGHTVVWNGCQSPVKAMNSCQLRFNSLPLSFVEVVAFSDSCPSQQISNLLWKIIINSSSLITNPNNIPYRPWFLITISFFGLLYEINFHCLDHSAFFGHDSGKSGVRQRKYWGNLETVRAKVMKSTKGMMQMYFLLWFKGNSQVSRMYVLIQK